MQSIARMATLTGSFVISLDFELLWGVRDHSDRQAYGANVLGARVAIPRILDLFADGGIRATWATVGFLMCADRDELLASLPPEALRPSYKNARLSNYRYLDEVGSNEAQDPYYFGATLVERIADTPGQEIGSHTLSHYYCLEEGQSIAAFEADLQAARSIAQKRGVHLRSLVFPRNQFSEQHLEICARNGFTSFRGNPVGWTYRPTSVAQQTLFRRALRLSDAYSGVLGHHTYRPQSGECVNVPASRFLRPCSGRLARIHSLHLDTIKRGMTAAAKYGRDYHLWWHPHNFGSSLEDNLAGLQSIIAHLCELRDCYGFVSRTMSDCA